MGELISLSEHRARRARSVPRPLPSGFYYDLGCPFSYLAAERFERLLGETAWYAAPARTTFASEHECARGRYTGPAGAIIQRHDAESAAAALRLPLTWPDNFGGDTTGLHRAAVCATELGAGSRFALAAMRLGFCGGFDPSDPAIVIEAAAAAGLPIEPCLAAATDAAYDRQLDAIDGMLTGAGVGARPAVQLGDRFFSGRHAVVEAAALRASWQSASTSPAS